MTTSRALSLLLAAVLTALCAHAVPLEETPLNSEDFVDPPDRSMPGILWFWNQTPMTPALIEDQLDEMHAAGFRGVMMFPLQSTPKFYTEEFYELFEIVLRHAEQLGMSIWLTNDQAIPTGHGATMVVPGGKVHEGLVLEPRPDLRAEELLHVNLPVSGGRGIDLVAAFPGYHDLPPTITYPSGVMNGRSLGAIVGNGGGNWIDYKYQLKVVPKNWAGNSHVPSNYTETGWMFRAEKESLSGYAWALSDRTRLGQGVPALRKMIVRNGKPVNELPPVKLPFELEEKAYDVEVVMLGGRIETFINGVSVDVTEDTTFTSGSVGLFLPHPCRGQYDDIKVLSHGDDLLFADACDNDAGWRFWGPSADVEEVFSVAAVPVVEGKPLSEGIVDLTSTFRDRATWSAPAGEWSLEFFMKRKDHKMPFNYPDLYHPDTIRRHLKITYGEILRRYPWAIGKTFKGFWSDEPHSMASKGKVWSGIFEEKLRAAGHEIAPTLAAVFNDLGREGRRMQAPYYQQVIEGWADPFARIQGEWCASHGVDFMTNPVIDSSPPYGAFSGGNGLQMNQWSSAPGVDAIYNQIVPGKRSLISRWATSSAHQMGRQHVLYEVFGGYGWDVTPDMVRYVNSYLMVRGCNRASYHAYWTNPDAVGYAPPFDPSNSWWSVQGDLNRWNGRLQEMSLGKTLSNVGLLNPTSTLYADEMNLNGRLMNPAFNEVYYLLEDHQVVFDLVDETSLNGNPIMTVQGVPVHQGMQVGQQRYQVIVLPRAHTVSLEAMQSLSKMVEMGGVVIATHLMPKEELKGRDDELKKLLQRMFGDSPAATPHRSGSGWTAFVEEISGLPALFAQVPGPFGQSPVRAVRMEKEYPNIRVIKRERANAVVYLIMNEAAEAVEPQVTFQELKAPEIWDPETGAQSLAPVFSSHGQWGIRLPLALSPFQTKVVVFHKEGKDPVNVPHLISAPVGMEVREVKASPSGGFRATVTSESDEAFELEGAFEGTRCSSEWNGGELPPAIDLAGTWKLRFDDDAESFHEVVLGSWTEHRPEFSGTASYSIRFHLDGPMLNAGRQWRLDLGEVADVATVEINGEVMDALLWAPYIQDLTAHLKAGENQLKVSIANTLANRHGQDKPSGLLGPVQLVPSHHQVLEFTPQQGSGYQPVVKPSGKQEAGEPITTQFVYHKVGDADLALKVWYPPTWREGDPNLPATVFFFGGGWYTGAISQFDQVAPYLAERGMVVITPEYRTARDGVEPNLCLEDAKSAMRYIRMHADDLGVDPQRLAAGGRSAGGHLAAATAFCDGFDAPGDDPSVSPKPTALVLFNPVIDNGPGGFRHEHVKEYWEDFSPLHNISENPPPTIFLTGDRDQYTPIETARHYEETQKNQGGRCDLVVFEGGVHGSPFAQAFYPTMMEALDRFLVSIGYLASEK